MSKKIMLEFSSNDYHVTEEGFEQIKALIAQVQVCSQCEQHIDDRLPLVGKHCLECVVRETGFTLIGLKEIKDGKRVYEFKDDEGIVYTSTENASDIHLTLDVPPGFVVVSHIGLQDIIDGKIVRDENWTPKPLSQARKQCGG